MDHGKVIVRDVPYFVWLFGLGFFIPGVYLALEHEAPLLISGLLSLIGILLILMVPIVTVSIDQGRGVLVIQHTSVLRRKRRELITDRVSRVYVERKVSTNSDGTSSTYRVVLGMEDGEQVPLRQSTTSGFSRKANQAEAIRQALGLEEEPITGVGYPSLGQVSVPKQIPESLQAQTGISPGTHETNGVRWELEALSFGGVGEGSPVYRWSSMDFETPGYFIYLAQKVERQGSQKGLLNLVGNLLFKQSLKMYGFDESFTPGLDSAKTVEDVDHRLVDQFFIHTSDPAQARRVLNPWVVMPLIGWAERYAIQKRAKKYHQLTVLFSPWGVYASLLNTLDSVQLDELVRLGVELVRAQGVLPRPDPNESSN